MDDQRHIEKNNAETTNNNTIKINLGADMVFTLILALIVGVFFIDALDFHPVSARAPLIVMVPLVILFIIHLIKLRKQTNFSEVKEFLSTIFKGNNENYKKIVQLTFWMIVFMVFIYAFGYYVSSALFLLILLRFISKEKWRLTLSLMLVVPFVLFLLFEVLLGLELYRGIIYMIWRGYDVF